MLKVFNLLYISEQESKDLLQELDKKEVEYTVIAETNQETGWVCVEDADEYDYARDVIDDYLDQAVKKKPKKYKKKNKKGLLVLAVIGAIVFLSRYLKEIFAAFA